MFRGAMSLAATVVVIASGAYTPNAFAEEPRMPRNTIPCKPFKRLPNGNWFAAEQVTFDIGPVENITLANQEIGPGFMSVGGVTLFQMLDHKCGKTSR